MSSCKAWTERDQRVELAENPIEPKVRRRGVLTSVVTASTSSNGGGDSRLVQHPSNGDLRDRRFELDGDRADAVSYGKAALDAAGSEHALEPGRLGPRRGPRREHRSAVLPLSTPPASGSYTVAAMPSSPHRRIFSRRSR